MEKDNEVIGLKKIIVGYLYHWKLFLSIFIVSIILGCLYYIFVPTTYEMVARIQLQEDVKRIYERITGTSILKDVIQREYVLR